MWFDTSHVATVAVRTWSSNCFPSESSVHRYSQNSGPFGRQKQQLHCVVHVALIVSGSTWMNGYHLDNATTIAQNPQPKPILFCHTIDADWARCLRRVWHHAASLPTCTVDPSVEVPVNMENGSNVCILGFVVKPVFCRPCMRLYENWLTISKIIPAGLHQCDRFLCHKVLFHNQRVEITPDSDHSGVPAKDAKARDIANVWKTWLEVSCQNDARESWQSCSESQDQSWRGMSSSRPRKPLGRRSSAKAALEPTFEKTMPQRYLRQNNNLEEI